MIARHLLLASGSLQTAKPVQFSVFDKALSSAAHCMVMFAVTTRIVDCGHTCSTENTIMHLSPWSTAPRTEK